MTSTQQFGTAAHNANLTAQNLNQGSSGTKSTVVVLLCPTVNGNQIYRAENNGNVTQTVAQGKALNRLTDLLAIAGNDAAVLEVLGTRGGAAASIDERVKLKDSAAMILRYTVNGNVERLQKLISEALFKVAEKAANDNTTLASYASRFGVHAIAVTSESSSHGVVNSLRDQLEAIERNEANFVPALKANVDQINAPVINWNETKAEVVLLEGAALSFVVRSEVSRVNFLINPIKGNKVGNALDVFKRENQSSVSIEEKAEALIAIGYDLGAMPDEEIALAYQSERADFLEGAGEAAAESEEENDLETEDDAEESEEETEEGDDEEEFDAAETLAGILLNANLDRAGLKKLVFVAGGKVFTSDTEETLTTKLLDLVGAFEYNELFAFLIAANEKLGGNEALATYIHAESEEVNDDVPEEDSEEDSEDEDDSEDADEDQDDEDQDDEDQDDEDGEDEDATFDPVSEFASLVAAEVGEGELNRDAVRVIARSASFGLTTFKKQSATDILELILNALAETEFADVEEFEQLVRELGENETVAAHFPSFVGYEVNPVDYTELFQFEGGELSHDQRVAALEAAGEEIENDGKVAVLKQFEQYRLENGYVADDEDEAEDLEDDEEADAENADIDAEEEADAENDDIDAEEAEEQNDENFVEESSSNDLGTFLRVRQEQTLLVNFTLTDRDTFENISEELADQSGVNYRVPFNLTDEVEGAMYLPLTVATDLLSGSAALPFMSERSTFNVETYSEKLGNTMRSQLDALLYEGRLEAGQDPYEHGLVLGDFIDDEDEIDEDDLSEEYLSELIGDHVPMASLYNAHVSVRPVTVDTESTVLNTVVLNIALPCIWGLDKKKVSALVTSAYNRVVSHIGETDMKVYVGFTLNAGSLVSDEALRNVVKSVSDMASDEIEVASYTTNDVQRVNEADDLMEAAMSLGTTNLPLILLSSGVADAAFANGGDLTLLLSDVSGIVADEDEDESEE